MDSSVQSEACLALWIIAEAVSPAARAVLRAGSVVQLLNTARENHPSDGLVSVQTFVRRALEAFVDPEPEE